MGLAITSDIILLDQEGEVMKRKLTVFLSCFAVILAFVVGQAMAVNVSGEGAYTATDVQVCIYADISSAEALRSFGVRLLYNSDELTYDDSKSTRNEAVWHLRDEHGTDHPCNRVNCGPKNVEVSSTEHAVVMVGGYLDGTLANPGEAKVAGERVLLGTVWFTRASGSGPLTNNLTLDLGQENPYANFVKGPGEGDVLDGSVNFVSSGVVVVHERGDANGDGNITGADRGAVKYFMVHGGVLHPWMDCNGDGVITGADRGCIKYKMTH